MPAYHATSKSASPARIAQDPLKGKLRNRSNGFPLALCAF